MTAAEPKQNRTGRLGARRYDLGIQDAAEAGRFAERLRHARLQDSARSISKLKCPLNSDRTFRVEVELDIERAETHLYECHANQEGQIQIWFNPVHDPF